jgi:TolB-like protein/DNA-binding winged helix-turn-helix (wHTH) protein/Tfp pilus assembly protein PilF
MSSHRICFGPFELDTKAGELRRGGRRVRLQEKPLKLLQALVEQPGETLSRDELRTRLWPPPLVVDFDNGLNNAANKLRAVLGDSPSAPRYIETVGRRGYRFIGEVAAHAPASDVAAHAAAPDGWLPAPRKSTTPRRALQIMAGAGLVAAGAGLAAWLLRPPPPVASDGRIESLAVLPLDNLSSDPEQEYFSDGMTEALIAQLAGVRSLRVMSRQSSMRFKNSASPMPAIAKELGVEGIIEGTVLRTGDRVRISVQLVHGPSDTHVWAEQYERPLDDVLALQAEIAQAVAAEVRAALTPQDEERLARPADIDAEAYDLYLRGRHLWSLRTEDGLRRSLEYFERVIALAPQFAPAHAAVAEAYGPLGYLGFMSPDEATPRMKAAALRALELDPNLVEGWTALGACAAFHEWRWEEGERHFERAVSLGPNYSTAFGWYGLLFENTGRQAENLAARRRAFELDPLWVGTGAAYGQALFFAGQADEGIAQLERTLELDPDHAVALSYLGLVYAGSARWDDAIAAFARAGNDGGLGHAYAMAGRRAEALEVRARLERRSAERYVSPFQLALVRLGLGDVAEALDALDAGFAIRDPGMSGLKVDPRFAPLAGEPRFRSLLERMGLAG